MRQQADLRSGMILHLHSNALLLILVLEAATRCIATARPDRYVWRCLCGVHNGSGTVDPRLYHVVERVGEQLARVGGDMSPLVVEVLRMIHHAL